MSCLINPNTTITNTIQWWQVSDTIAQNRTCETTYLRPDVGGALMPWLFTVMQIAVHLPVIIVRVASWEDVQTLSIVLAIFNIALVSQAYLATKLAAEHILVWTPMTLVLDAGAMLQLLVLVRANRPDWWEEFLDVFRNEPRGAAIPMEPLIENGENCYPASNNRPSHRLYAAFVMFTSFVLFFAIVGLQITGLVYAFRGHNNDDNINASWCSPMFGAFGLSELDSDCNFHPITGDPQKGIGCVELPGARQRTWLTITMISMMLSVIIEGIDFIILTFVPLHKHLWKLELKRPWFTMVFGLAVLVLILTVGSVDAYNLPEGISERIWMIVDTGTQPFVCSGILTPAGLRGQFLGWLDGLLEGWDATYFGSK